MNKIKKIAAPILVLALGVGTVVVLNVAKPEPEKKNQPPRPVSVFVEPVIRENIELKVNSQGEVRARTAIELIAQVGGKVVSVSPEFTEGGMVGPGEVLVTIESTDYELALGRAQARVAEAEVRVQQANADADVAQKQLRDQKNVSALALKKPQVAEANAMLKAAHADLQQAELNLSRTHISVPFNGRITQKLVGVGEYVIPGKPLGSVFATDVVEVRLPFTDSQLASLGLPIGYSAPEEGGPVVELRATVAGRDQVWQGELVRLDASIDSATRMLYGMVEVINPYGRNASPLGMPLAVGLFVSAEIAGPEVADAYVISRNALRAGNSVYLIDKNGHLDIREVDVLHSTVDRAVISSGLHEGEKVIVSAIRNPIVGMSLEAQSYSTETSIAKQGIIPNNSVPVASSGG